ncbi:MAG: hypothetical protein ACD_11C00157G0002, partial [uncultured bacterium]
MNLIQAKKTIGKVKWYKQGGGVKFLYICYPWLACSLMKMYGIKIPVKYKVIFHIKNDFMDDYISKDSLKKVALFYHKKQMQNREFIGDLISNWHRDMVVPFLAINREIADADFSKFDQKEFLRIHDKFNKIYMSVWHEAIFLDGFDYYGEYLLEEFLKKEAKNIRTSDLDLLLIPPQPSFTQKERIAIFKLARKVLRNEEMKKDIIDEKRYDMFSERYPQIKKELEKISTDFYWMHNDFAIVGYLDPDHYYNSLREILSSEKGIDEEKEMTQSLKSLKVSKRKVVKKYNLSPEFVNLTDFLAVLGNFRDERKSYNQMAGNSIKKFALEFAMRSGVELKLIESLTFWELASIFKDKNKLVKIAKDRMRGVTYLEDAKITNNIFYGQSAADLNEFLNEGMKNKIKLKGRVAFPGIVVGTAKIVKDKNDFYKMKKGDILV